MERGIITISKTGAVGIVTAPVWMTQFEIADLLGVFSYDIRKAIYSIYKNKELDEAETRIYIKQPYGISYDTYSIEMIIAIAFRIYSRESILFRQFIIDKMSSATKETPITLFVSVAEVVTYGIVESISPITHSRCTDAKVAYGYDGKVMVRRQCRFGVNLPPMECIQPEKLLLPATRLKGIRQRKQATDWKSEDIGTAYRRSKILVLQINTEYKFFVSEWGYHSETVVLHMCIWDRKVVIKVGNLANIL